MKVASFKFSRALMRAWIFSFSVRGFSAARRLSGPIIEITSNKAAEMILDVFIVAFGTRRVKPSNHLKSASKLRPYGKSSWHVNLFFLLCLYGFYANRQPDISR